MAAENPTVQGRKFRKPVAPIGCMAVVVGTTVQGQDEQVAGGNVHRRSGLVG